MLGLVRRGYRLIVLIAGSLGLALFTRVKPHRWIPPGLSLRLLRAYSESGPAAMAEKMRAHLPEGGRTVRRDLSYDPAAGRDGLFDLVLPDGDGPFPVIVWAHGGGWTFGAKSDPLPYLELLATHGYAGATINYPRIPEHRHPSAAMAMISAVRHLVANAVEYRIDPARLMVAGDSAGANLAASTALASTNPGYAEQLGVTGAPVPVKATALFCGTFDTDAILEAGRVFTSILGSSMWAQAGTRNWQGTKPARLMSVTNHVTAAFPPTFIRAGNDDPLTEKGTMPLGAALTSLGVRTDCAVLGTDADPAPHEIQFMLGTAYGQEILGDLVAFLDRELR